MYKYCFLILLFSQPSISGHAQALNGMFNISLALEFLHSTHATNFKGISLELNRNFGNTFEGGLGFEYSWCKYHDDNGLDLYHLKFAPVFLTQRFYFLRKDKLDASLHLREGLSFIGYDKEGQDNPGLVQHVNETGFYGYSGLVAAYNVTKKMNVFLEPGLKSFHISTNNLDVNPHGFNLNAGVKYYIK